ncbi:hypothetical protein ACFV3R_33530 [Streptomyces sp. NPDC059740]|uniref:hypothetical protein n=1 Tax=Streptomyces sp. NPDC059740 TaxID=3346926 RepID=UPI003650CE37
MTAPSTHRQSGLEPGSDRAPGCVHEPTAFLLHLFTASGCMTHTVPVGHAADRVHY